MPCWRRRPRAGASWSAAEAALAPDAWRRFEATRDIDPATWDALDARYAALAQDERGDALERALLARILERREDFEPVLRAAFKTRR